VWPISLRGGEKRPWGRGGEVGREEELWGGSRNFCEGGGRLHNDGGVTCQGLGLLTSDSINYILFAWTRTLATQKTKY